MGAKNQGARGAASVEATAADRDRVARDEVGAGARALMHDLKRKADQAEIVRILTRASFPWAAPDRRVLRVPDDPRTTWGASVLAARGPPHVARGS